MNCQQVVEHQYAERYLLGQLAPADHQAYEHHYFECSRCFEQLQTRILLCTELNRSAAAIRSEPTRQPIIRRRAWASVLLALLLTAAIGTWEWRRTQSSARKAQPGQSQLAATHSGNNDKSGLKTLAPETDRRHDALVALAAVEAPTGERSSDCERR